MNSALAKLTRVSSGDTFGKVFTAERINAIQDAIRGLYRGENIVAGHGMVVNKTGNSINIGRREPRQEGNKKQNFEWTYFAENLDHVAKKPGSLHDNAYKEIDGISIGPPRTNNLHDDEETCGPVTPPVNLTAQLSPQYLSGNAFLKSAGDYMYFTEPGIFEVEFDVTAMMKLLDCEPGLNHHTHDLATFAALGNRGKTPEWDPARQEWIWDEDRSGSSGAYTWSDRTGGVLIPDAAIDAFTIHAKQRLSNDQEARISFYDPEKQIGFRGDAIIKYRQDCFIDSVPNTECTLVTNCSTSTTPVVCSFQSIEVTPVPVICSTQIVDYSATPVICSTQSVSISSTSMICWNQHVEVDLVTIECGGIYVPEVVIPISGWLSVDVMDVNITSSDCVHIIDTDTVTVSSSDCVHTIYTDTVTTGTTNIYTDAVTVGTESHTISCPVYSVEVTPKTHTIEFSCDNYGYIDGYITMTDVPHYTLTPCGGDTIWTWTGAYKMDTTPVTIPTLVNTSTEVVTSVSSASISYVEDVWTPALKSLGVITDIETESISITIPTVSVGTTIAQGIGYCCI